MMSKTIFITGASSGIGQETASFFEKKGWNVAATMRKPEKDTFLKESDRLIKIKLDVLDEGQVQDAINETIAKYGKIDVVLNNAGYGASGPLEKATSEQFTRQFDVNVKGIFLVTKYILPHFRANKSGRILNVSSVGGRTTFPLFSLYHGTKFAVEGISESLNYELNPLGIDVKLIEPGGVRTDFASRSLDWFEADISDYDTLEKKFKSLLENATEREMPSAPIDVAKVIFEAATTKSKKIRYVVGKDAKLMLRMRKFLGVNGKMKMVKRYYKI